MSLENSNDRGLLRVMILGTALACGAMAASLQALQAGPGGFYFRVSWVSGVVFACGTAAVLWIWKIMLKDAGTPRQRFLRGGAKWVLLLSAVAAFLYPLRFVPKAKLPEIGIGLGMAAFALSIVGSILWTIRRFLEREEKEGEAE